MTSISIKTPYYSPWFSARIYCGSKGAIYTHIMLDEHAEPPHTLSIAVVCSCAVLAVAVLEFRATNLFKVSSLSEAEVCVCVC